MPLHQLFPVVALCLAFLSHVACSSTGAPPPKGYSTKVKSTTTSARSGAKTGSAVSSIRLATCTSTKVVTLVVTSTPSAIVDTTTVVSTDYINGDDGFALSATTYTEVDVITSSVNRTLTTTLTLTPTTHTAPDVTVTVPTPSGFLPVQDTQTNLIYVDQGPNKRAAGRRESFPSPVRGQQQRRAATPPCATITSTSTSVVTLRAETSTTTVTAETVLLAFPAEGTTIPYDQYSPPPTYYTETTTTSTQYLSTITKTVNASTTSTVPVATSTYYAACDERNFANFGYTGSDGVSGALLAVTKTTGKNLFDTTLASSPYDCCVFAVGITTEQEGVYPTVWEYSSSGQYCSVSYGDDVTVCGKQSENAQWEAELGTQVDLVVGNGLCGEFKLQK